MPTLIDDSDLDRLRQAAANVADAESSLADAIRTRDRIVVEMVDAGFAQRSIARAMGKSRGLVTQILARP